MSRRAVALCAVLVAAAWAIEGRQSPGPATDNAEETTRREELRRALVHVPPDAPPLLDWQHEEFLASPPDSCTFVPEAPSGTTSKFTCVLDDGEHVKVKYNTAELHAEAAATRLLIRLGFAADTVTIVPRLRCYRCPRDPFAAMQLASLFGGALAWATATDRDYTDFEQVAVERKFPAPAIETSQQHGWAWWELAHSRAPREELDQLRLAALFLAHWDNKAQNQRLVCLDGTAYVPRSQCDRPLLMIQDLGATFGPVKVNLSGWETAPIWVDRRTCVASMRSLPHGGATFADVRISEAARLAFVGGLASISDSDLRTLFTDARFPAFYSSTDDERDLAAWVAAFRHRANEIANAGPCPATSS